MQPKKMFSLLLHSNSFPPHASETDMARRGIDRLRVARGGTVALAVIRSTQVRSTLEDLARDSRRVGRIDALLNLRPARVRGNAAGFGSIRQMPGNIPVLCPFPCVADHVVEAVTVGRISPDR